MLGHAATVEERETIDGVDWHEVASLFAAVGWGNRCADDLRSAFEHSTHKVLLFERDRLIALGRTVGDGVYYAHIVDVVVAPSHQRRGLGARVVQRLTAKLTGFLSVTLTAAPEVRAFYERLGWRRQHTAMMLPRSPEQAAAHCDGAGFSTYRES